MIEKIKELMEKAFNSDIKSVWAWVAAALGISIGFRGKTAFDRYLENRKKTEEPQKPKGLRDKLKDLVNGTDGTDKK